MFQKRVLVEDLEKMREIKDRKIGFLRKDVNEMSPTEMDALIATEKQTYKLQNEITNGIKLDHCIHVTKTFREELMGKLHPDDSNEEKDEDSGSSSATKFIRKGQRNLKSSNPAKDKETGAGIVFLPINPQDITGFNNLKDQYEYFAISKVTVNFQSNSAGNLAPILGKYLGPRSGDYNKEINTIQQRLTQATKGAEAQSNKKAKMALNDPYYMKSIVIGQDTIDLPDLGFGLISTKYDPEKIKLNYGTFAFESRCPTVQELFVEVFYTIEFYTTVNYEGMKVSDDELE